MELKKVNDLFSLSKGDVISKRNLFDLIQFSKVKASSYWSGQEFIIGNTPQQGINWIGHFPKLRAVIIKTLSSAYKDDDWIDKSKMSYRYSFKARKGGISYTEKANRSLIQQPQHLYPILLFAEQKSNWRFDGIFSVTTIENHFVILTRLNANISESAISQDELYFQEGTQKYVTHIMAERNTGVTKILKETNEWICDICEKDFYTRYGAKYIEAHHKIPISTYSSNHKVAVSDFSLLCPNCHKAVHIYMKEKNLKYKEIKEILKQEPSVQAKART